MNKEITLCSSKLCPWTHCVELALIESGVEYKRLEVDWNKKQTWCRLDMNSEGKPEIPTIIYGEIGSQPNDPSVQYLQLTNATVIIEFIVNLTTAEPLLPATPKSLKKMHLFIETFTSNFVPTWDAIVSLGHDPSNILPSIEAIQALLPSDGYAVGQWSVADAIAAPFLARTIPCLKNNLVLYRESDKYARFKRYYVDLTSRDSFKQTFHEDVNAVITLSPSKL
ncbi:hypothetical protein H1R20_g10805, partial [Candolleomyces eurysporus]